MRTSVLGIGSFAIAAAAAFTAAPTRADVIGTSIGTDLVVDSSFGTTGGYTVVNYNDDAGTWDEVVRLIPADGGGTWMTGFHRTDANGDRFAIARLDANGVLDPSYGDGGKRLADTAINLIRDVILVEDRFYLTGIHYLDGGLGDAVAACVMLDGTPCAGFGDAGSVELPLNAPGFNSDGARILERNGALYVIGNTDPGGKSGHSSAIVVAKLDAATGALDPGFGDGSGPLPGSVVYDPNLIEDSWDFAYAAAFAGNGDILVGGSAQYDRGTKAYVLALDPATGAPDGAFGDGGFAWASLQNGVHSDELTVRALHVYDDGRIVAAGNANHDDEFFNSITGILLLSLQPDGTRSPGFGVDGLSHVDAGINLQVTDFAVRPNGDLLVSTPSNGLVPDDYISDSLQSVLQFDAAGNGPTATISFEYPSLVQPQGWPMSLLVDADDRVLVGGARLWDYIFPVPDADHVVTRLVRDVIFANGFDGLVVH
ncbi:hypothetical protein [Dokdonella fugitiva]|uniref:Putative delta-60 repeat protein n=1 Tax=Dokdonella fugitiva TaxID=328517 RepID=A0A4R2IE32_9GAMM|nr:hypothetical protein [Dokdonella fugitiva]MBA8882292.1 putative delta-60 repeat protein [Dokdonella fugitiva]TCO42901.1 putative delta-60 repeat protein [Dokdonella fugitiva]